MPERSVGSRTYLELWRGEPGLVVLQDYGEDGWDMYLQADPNTVSIAGTLLALNEWSQANYGKSLAGRRPR